MHYMHYYKGNPYITIDLQCWSQQKIPKMGVIEWPLATRQSLKHSCASKKLHHQILWWHLHYCHCIRGMSNCLCQVLWLYGLAFKPGISGIIANQSGVKWGFCAFLWFCISCVYIFGSCVSTRFLIFLVWLQESPCWKSERRNKQQKQNYQWKNMIPIPNKVAGNSLDILIVLEKYGVSFPLVLRLVMLIIPNHIVGFETYDMIVKMGSSSPTFGVNIKNIWVANTQIPIVYIYIFVFSTVFFFETHDL